MKNKLLHIWKKISENGISDDLDNAEKKRVRVLNRIIFINALLAFVNIIIDIVNSSFASNFVAISISFTTFTFSPLLFLLLMKKYYKVAKWTVIFIFVFFISFIAILTGKDSGIILYFIPGILFPTILFQRKKTILVLTSLIIGVLIVVLFINQIYNPQLITSQSELNFYFISNLIGSAILTLLVIWYFKSTNSEYEKIITEKNNSLSAYNTEINAQKLQLEAKNIENEQLVVNLESTVEERTLTLKESLNVIEEKEKNYGDLLDKSSEMIQMLDPEGRITYVNQAWLENMKFDGLDEVLGRPIVDFFTQNTLTEFETVMPRLMKGELVEDLECQFISKENNEIALKGRARPILKDGNFSGSQAFFFNITEVQRAKREMDQMTSFKEIMLNITTEYINAPISEIDDVINASLLEISEFSSADRAYVFKYNFEEEICSITHEWVGEGIPSQLEELKAMPFSKVPHSLKKHSKGEFVEFPDVSKIKDKRIFNVLHEEGTQSMISIPMMHNDRAIGFIGFDIMNTKREFTADEKNLLWIYSQMLVNVFNRIAFIEELQTTKNELAEINLSLEKKVFENTKKNMDLSRSIMEQEKLVTIGEISAGIAHDLNTPLGTIRVGADNINFILSSLFNGSICDFTKEELSHILNHVEKNRIEMYVGGLQMRKEKAEMLEFLNASISGKIPDALAEICDLLVKCRFNPSQEQEISMILSKPFAKEYLQVMNQLQMAMAQLETIRKSSDKAVGVVQDMRAFIKGESVVEQKMINLRDNISTVLGVFNYEISLHVNLVFEVDPSIEFMGYDIKLFQLWSNIVKNGLEAMSEQKERYYGIFAERKEGELKVVFENNGPKIPDEIAETIFQKFYTTKAKKSGSGLGLSIVKNVLKEHQANIIVESSETLTKFIITFDI
tara:strand:- start:1755 stop:4466 length:2712 start_codon:yes stop_codon:yes gene_type:complete